MNFGEALEQVKKGKGMRLPYWKEGVVVRVQYPKEFSKMTAPYLYISIGLFDKYPWQADVIELFSEDWEVVE